MSKAKNIYRYPGANSFTTEQAHLFMGREQDRENLYQLILARQIVVLYGKSGYGKSSLINAGIIPMLEQESFEKPKHFSIRLYNKEQSIDAFSKSPLNTFITALSTNTEELAWMQDFKKNAYPRGLLWYWIKQHQIQQPEAPIILFFDQFEELFTYSEQEIEAFAAELNLLLYQRMPDFLSKREYFTQLDNQQTNFIFTKPDIKIVFSIRSDRMSLLNRLAKYLPNILKFNYELDALTESEARQAIIKPAQLQGEEFINPTFRYENAVIDAIINRVKNSYDDKIETATLQIILRFIEEHKVPKLEGKPITLELLGNIKDIFKDFYQTSLNKLSKEEKAIVSQTIEEKFIQNNQRIPFAGDHLKQEYHLTDIMLEQLEKSTLLRKERDTAGRFIYEIGHDTLIEPILEFAKIREQEEKQKRLRKNIAIVGAIALAFLFIIFYVLRLTQKAEQAKEEAQEALYQLYYQQAQTVKDNGDNILRNKDTMTAQYYYESASVILEKIPETDSIATELKSELQKLLKK
ncbi:nSTAND1 domain-containing NTPase [Arcicella rigui]|uniref:Novel STAND NTPase 1 domain-containing protein n=1 Tax=Arcicella rigui TaxID=797020 RepID=A0ABU5QGK1_9BACT|nr:hypothetical protein [Arcicella rigui]MEA5141733.1 hypothetical protein [Arcicella rigui]